jgi:predicted DNA-binding transcriptional regulator AlpA
MARRKRLNPSPHSISHLGEYVGDVGAGRIDRTTSLTDVQGACQILGGIHTPIHPATLYRGIKAGRYPKPIRVGGNTSRWLVGELQASIERAAAAREGA